MIITTALKRLLKRPQTQRLGAFLVRKVASAFTLDLLTLAYKSNGILNSRNEYESGEYHLRTHWLRRFLSLHAIDKPCFFDVGANVGDYSRHLSALYPDAEIYAFEPNAYTFQRLKTLSDNHSNVNALNVALGSATGEASFFHRQSNVSSIHATLYKEVMTELWGYADVEAMSVPLETLDNFCYQRNVQRIDFLKIDTEGHEFQVLLGAENVLQAGIVRSIQFEFNKMNVFSRVFLRDFAELLPDFNFYRLLPNSLLPIHYHSRHEIFLFQNLLAVRKTVDPLAK